jgi:flavodoxin
MKTAVVFYSLDGNCALVAEEIKSRLDADLIRLQTMDEKKRGKIGKLFWGGGMVISRKKPPLKPYSFDASAYDLIIIGAPVWAGSSAPPVHTFLSQAGIKGKRVALFVCHAGGKGSSLEKFKALLAGNDIIAAADFKEPAKNDNEALKQLIADWVRGF